MISDILKMGRNMQMTMPPTTTPRKTINNGSMSEVRHWHGVTDRRGEGAGETREADFMRNRPEDRQFDSGSVPELTAGLGLDVEKPPVHRQAQRWQDEQDVRLEDVANGDEKLRGAWKLRAEPAVNFAENRHDLDQ